MDTNSNFVSLTDDTLFKEIFGREKNAFILEHFLELYFHLKPGELKGKLKYQMECTLEKGKYRDKNCRGDNLVVFDHLLIDLEMYSNFDKDDLSKTIFYTSRIYGTQLDMGAEYSKAKPLISINIVDQVKNQNLIFNGLESKYGFCYQTHPLGSQITIVFIRLDILRKIAYNVCENDFITFMRMIGAKDEEERKRYAKKGEFFMSVERVIERFMNDEEANEMFSLENKIKETGKSIGRAEGRVEGAKTRNNEIAQNMLREKLDTSIISKVTGLSEQEICSLQTA